LKQTGVQAASTQDAAACKTYIQPTETTGSRDSFNR